MTTNNSAANETKAHPFELAGMGTGPYVFKFAFSIPSASLAEKNPEAYNAQLRTMPKLTAGCGTCSNCGMAISNVCVVASSDGRLWGVGCDCVEKTGDAFLGTAAKVAVARIVSAKRRAAAESKRIARHNAWLDTVNPANGETNRDRLAREAREVEENRARKSSECVARWGFLLPALDALPRGGFAESVARGIRDGFPPIGRAVEICRDIYAKQKGRRGSQGYTSAEAEFDTALQD